MPGSGGFFTIDQALALAVETRRPAAFPGMPEENRSRAVRNLEA